jgi:hypothetical protein
LSREADGEASALAFVAAGFGVSPQPVRIPLRAVWKKNGLYSEVVSNFVTALSEACAAAA